MATGVATGPNRVAGGAALPGLAKGTFEQRAFPGQAIHVGRLYFLAAVTPECMDVVLVRHDKEYVARLGSRGVHPCLERHATSQRTGQKLAARNSRCTHRGVLSLHYLGVYPSFPQVAFWIRWRSSLSL